MGRPCPAGKTPASLIFRPPTGNPAAHSPTCRPTSQSTGNGTAGSPSRRPRPPPSRRRNPKRNQPARRSGPAAARASTRLYLPLGPGSIAMTVGICGSRDQLRPGRRHQQGSNPMYALELSAPTATGCKAQTASAQRRIWSHGRVGRGVPNLGYERANTGIGFGARTTLPQRHSRVGGRRPPPQLSATANKRVFGRWPTVIRRQTLPAPEGPPTTYAAATPHMPPRASTVCHQASHSKLLLGTHAAPGRLYR